MTESAPMVYVVDDDASYLMAVSRLLWLAGYEVRTFSRAEDFLSQLTDSPGCVIADLEMPGLSGFDLQDALTRTEQTLPVIFLTGQGDIRTSVHAMRQGAEDFLTKRAPKDDLFKAVRSALDRNARQRAKRARTNELRARFADLTSREREVLQCVAQGRLNRQIAAELKISVRTVKFHRAAIATKLNVHSVVELMRLVHEARALVGAIDTP